MAEKIESYQVGAVGEGAAFGDILSKRPVVSKPKVGLFAAGYFEYWRMWEGLEQKVVADMQRIADHLARCEEFDLVYPGFVDTMDKADEAGRRFHDEQIDLLIITEGTYLPDYFPVHAKRYVDNVPIIVYVPQSLTEIPKNITYGELMGQSGLVGLSQLTGGFAKMGWDFEVIVGPIDDETVYQEIATKAKLLDIINRLKFMKIGVYGHPFRGMFDIEYDKTKLQGALGPESIYVEERNLKAQTERVTEKQVAPLIAEMKQRFRIDPQLREEDIYDACRLTVAFEEIVKEYRLDALAILAQYNIELLCNDDGCYASSMLMEKDVMVCCEGDTSTVLMMVIMKMLTGVTPYYGEYTCYDLKENAFLFNHHGDGDPRLARSDKDIYVTYGPENWGCESLAMEFMVKPGPYTLGGLIDDAEGQKFLIAKGESLDRPPFRIQSPQVFFRPNMPIREFFKVVLESGFRHHAAIVPGDCSEELSLLADMLGIRKLVL